MYDAPERKTKQNGSDKSTVDVTEEKWENERNLPLKGWEPSLFRLHWSSHDGKENRDVINLEKGWYWKDEWKHIVDVTTDDDGWVYSKSGIWHFKAERGKLDLFRRRKWLRTRASGTALDIAPKMRRLTKIRNDMLFSRDIDSILPLSDIKPFWKRREIEHNCVKGSDFVNWLQQYPPPNYKHISRQQCASIGQEMLDFGILECMESSHQFLDGHFYYRFLGSGGTIQISDNYEQCTILVRLTQPTDRIGVTFQQRDADDEDGYWWQVSELDDNSLADFMEIRKKDIILRIGNETPDRFEKERRKQGNKRPITWEFCRLKKLELHSDSLHRISSPRAGSRHPVMTEAKSDDDIASYGSNANNTQHFVSHRRFSQPDMEDFLDFSLSLPKTWDEPRKRRHSVSVITRVPSLFREPGATIANITCSCRGCKNCSLAGGTVMATCLRNVGSLLQDETICIFCQEVMNPTELVTIDLGSPTVIQPDEKLISIKSTSTISKHTEQRCNPTDCFLKCKQDDAVPDRANIDTSIYGERGHASCNCVII